MQGVARAGELYVRAQLWMHAFWAMPGPEAVE
jgi:hypothetical protein